MANPSAALETMLADNQNNGDQVGVVENLLQILQGLVPVVDQIKQSIQESTSSIPRASVQLTSVTQATEMATVEILNELEVMTKTLSSAESLLGELEQSNKRRSTFEQALTSKLEELSVSQTGNAALEEVLAFWNGREQPSVELQQVVAVNECLKKAYQDSLNITIALQVQDITSQQIAGVLHLIEGVHNQLINILHHAEDKAGVGGIKKTGESSSEPPVGHSFDMNATYTKSGDRQINTDEIVQQWAANQVSK